MVSEARDYARDNGHPPVAHKTICVDFDATIIPWGSTMYDDSEPLPGAVDAIRSFKDKGYKVVIFTSRFSPSWWESEGWSAGYALRRQRAYVRGILNKHDIPFDAITAEKIPAVAYIDDKAIEFTGTNWPEIAERVLAL